MGDSMCVKLVGKLKHAQTRVHPEGVQGEGFRRSATNRGICPVQQKAQQTGSLTN